MFGFNYEDYEDTYTCFNFGLKNQRHTYDERILEHYKDNLAEGCVVYIVVTYPMILGGDDLESTAFRIRNMRYYTFLPSDLIKNYDLATDLKLDYAPADIYGDAGSKVKGLIKWLKKETVSYNSSWDHAATSLKDIQENANERYEQHFVTDKNDDEGNVIVSQDEIQAIYDMIALCKEIGARPILVTTPFMDEYLDLVEEREPEFMDSFIHLMTEISEETDVLWVDYSHDARIKSADLFIDTDHLNKKGAKVFTNILLEETLGK